MTITPTTIKLTGLWTPTEILLDSNLTRREKEIYSAIYHLDNEEGCFASNAYFADLFQVTTRRIQQIIKSLKDKGYIIVENLYRQGKKHFKRILRSCYKKAKEVVKSIPIPPKLDSKVQKENKMTNYDLTPAKQLINAFNRIYKEIYGKGRARSMRDSVHARELLKINSSIEVYENMFAAAMGKKDNIYSLAYFIHGSGYEEFEKNEVKANTLHKEIDNQMRYRSSSMTSTRSNAASNKSFVENYEKKQLLSINDPDNDLCLYFYGKLYCKLHFEQDITHHEKEFMTAFKMKYGNPMLLGYTADIDKAIYIEAKTRVNNKIDKLNRFKDLCKIYKWENKND